MGIVGHGIDIVAIARVDEMLQRWGERFTHRCFVDGERAYADAGRKRRAERYAARFAAKEAVLKALGTGLRDGIAWTDIAVVQEPSGRPALELAGVAADLARQQGIDRWAVSLSHAGPGMGEHGYATASVIGWAANGGQ